MVKLGTFFAAAIASLALVQGASWMFFARAFAQKAPACTASSRLHIVAAENFYQDIALQISGSCARVTSVLSDPDVDPHEYEPTVNDAEAVATANLVIENGGGYDDWVNKLLAASPDGGRLVINAWDISPVKISGNEHVWYCAEDMKAVAAAIAGDLKRLRPSQAERFEKNLTIFDESLDEIGAKIREISNRFSGLPIALTEPIFTYQADPMGLRVLTPFALQKAVAEGIDPPANAMLIAQEQIRNKRVRVLVYNRQTADRFTARLEELAKGSGVPVVAITETMPAGKHYQSWMVDQMDALESGLGGPGAGGGPR
ncbi:MAG: zinc ABC transporter substrate-binding protein [Syntrophobacteraceae bacterium]|nr:zinc ABC transporter substrate-binding protein [Syntrophobacteraceae bacterium]